jgi:hypothetical protein
MERKRLVLGVGSASLLMILLAPWTFAQGPVREITQIAGQVYRFQNQNHYSFSWSHQRASSPSTRSMPKPPNG